MRVSTPQEKYVNDLFGIQDRDLEMAREEMNRRDLDFMSISAAEGRILQFLIRGFKIRRVVEVGTLFGYSALCMAKALPSDGHIWTLEKNPENHAIANSIFQKSSVKEKITSLCGDAVDLLASLEKDGPFDLVFIDANKGGYVEYLNWAEANTRSGGLIVGDNTFLFGALWGETRDRDIGPNQIKVMNEFNTRLSDPAKYNSILIPTTEGMTVAQKLL